MESDTVAVKTLKGMRRFIIAMILITIICIVPLLGIFATSSDIEKVTQEIVKMSRFDHPNVMKLVGVCVAPAEQGGNSVGPSIVMPFMAKGSLLEYLRKEADILFATSEEEVNRGHKWLYNSTNLLLVLHVSGFQCKEAIVPDLSANSQGDGILSKTQVCAQGFGCKELLVSADQWR